MTCQECREKWSSLLDGEISFLEIKAVLKHIQSCQDCCKYCCELTCLNAMAQGLKPPFPSEHVWERVEAELKFAHVTDRRLSEGWIVIRSHLSRLGRV